jgi:hypothetical protein
MLMDPDCCHPGFPISPDAVLDRRSSQRYSIQLPVTYRTLRGSQSGESGNGSSLNISRNGVAFTTQERLPLGARVELLLDWPVLLNPQCGLRLSMRGRIVRSDDHFAALTILTHEFKTRRLQD